MFTRINSSSLSMSQSELEGLKLLNKYGNGDFDKARVAYIDEALGYSNEDFFEAIKNAATWTWNKIKELWNMFVAWIKKIFGAKSPATMGNNDYSVMSYGVFPPGYRPSELESKPNNMPEYTMRPYRIAVAFIDRIGAILKDVSGGVIANFFRTEIHNLQNDITNETPLCAFQRVIANVQRTLFEGIVVFNLANVQRAINANGNNTVYNFNSGDCYQIIQSDKFFANRDPYSQDSGWNSGAAFRDMIESGKGRLDVVSANIVTIVNGFNTNVINVIDAEKQKRTGLALSVEMETKIVQLSALADIFLKLFAFFATEINMLKGKVLKNAIAISYDINYQRQHSGVLGQK